MGSRQTSQLGKWFFEKPSVLVATLVCSSILFYVYSYNSGYGFDALEYLVIGRSLAQGYPMYTFIPSKSWGLYAFVAGALRLGVPGTHAGISTLVVLLFIVTLLSTWWVTNRIFGAGIALLNTILVALCAVFMELNYLEPESIVYLCGVAAFYLLAVADKNGNVLRPSRLFWAGFLGAAGCAFKVVAALYVVAIVVFLLMPSRNSVFNLKSDIRNVSFVLLGFVAGFVPQWLYFVATGRGGEFMTWTIAYPLLYYPHDNRYFSKLYTKLLWFVVLALLCMILALRKQLRMKLRSERILLLAGLMGVVSLLSLLKTQSSHYVFPGAAFLCLVFSWTIWMSAVQYSALTLKRTMVAATALTSLVGIAIFAYSPRVLGRLISWRDYVEERSLKRRLQSMVGRDDNFIATDGAVQLYWLSERYPPFPAVNTEAQTTWWLRNAPHVFADALQDSRVTLVEFNPANIQLDDPRAYTMGPWKPALKELQERLPDSFCSLMLLMHKAICSGYGGKAHKEYFVLEEKR